MKLPSSPPECRHGSALVGVLIMSLIAAGTALSILTYAAHSVRLTRRALEYQKARLAAEAGLDYAATELQAALKHHQFGLSQTALQTLLDSLPAPPDYPGFSYETPSGASAFRITVDSAVQSGTITQGFAAVGSEGQHQFFTITCGALNTSSGVGAVLREQVQGISIYLNRYGVFYDKDLEIDPGPLMEFFGPIHGNADLYIDGPINIHDRITSHGNILHGRKDNGTTAGLVSIKDESNNLVSMMNGVTRIDSRHPNWMTEGLTRWGGRVMDSAHAIGSLDPPYNPLSNPHDIIERPLHVADSNYHAQTESTKFANKSALVIAVDGAGNVSARDHFGANVTFRFTNAVLQTSGTYAGRPLHVKDANGRYAMTTQGAIDTSKTFTDGREGTTMAVVDIYVDKLLASYPEMLNPGLYAESQGRAVVYVTRQDPDGAGGVIPALRLRNGRELPTGGLTIASELPVYVEGDYNTVNAVKPALVAGDAVTLLSKQWQDARSAAVKTERIPANTTYNAVVMTGNSETFAGGAYNGGLENVLRFLEDWTGRTATFRGSIIDLWYGEMVTGPMAGTYYSPPNRNWGYDTLYRTQAPPGIPRVFGLESLVWTESTWAAEGW